MGNLQPAKIFYTAAWSLRFKRKHFTRLFGGFASSESILHGCLEVSLQAKIFYTAVWRFRFKRKHFTQLFGGFASSEGILHGCLPFCKLSKPFFTLNIRLYKKLFLPDSEKTTLRLFRASLL